MIPSSENGFSWLIQRTRTLPSISFLPINALPLLRAVFNMFESMLAFNPRIDLNDGFWNSEQDLKANDFPNGHNTYCQLTYVQINRLSCR